MAEKANLCLEDSLAVWTGVAAACVVGGSLALDFLACLRFFCYSSSVLSSVFPGVGVDGKRIHGDLQIVHETFLLPSL